MVLLWLRMKSLAFLMGTALLLLGYSSVAHADDATKLAKIEEMLTLTHADQMIQQVMAQMQPMMADQMKKLDLPDDARPAMAEAQKNMLEWMSNKLSWEKMKPVYVKIYGESFTEEEIGGIVEFYKSPVGQALLSKMPVLMQKSIALTQEMLKDMIPELTRMSQELAKKYKKQ